MPQPKKPGTTPGATSPPDTTKTYRMYEVMDGVHLKYLRDAVGDDAGDAHVNLVKEAPDYAGVEIVPIHESFVHPQIVNPRTEYDVSRVGVTEQAPTPPAPAQGSAPPPPAPAPTSGKLTRSQIAQKAADTRKRNAAARAAAGTTPPKTSGKKKTGKKAGVKKPAAAPKATTTTSAAGTRRVSPPSASVPPPPPPPPPPPSSPGNPFAEQ